ncbi:hypothetical protein PENCOP_c004G07093 [Penicillium coprophilum]|uniref:O-methyltransferase domain-containing protein n=1 Tax=Penicillium coprophilum TaxID=36646 RepID=A0A1V6UTT1_9EURO|nr:hypothetical protein PENCOP_c004G07093 [Penicillium coprophilum]
MNYFEWLGRNIDLAKDFQQWASLKQQTTSNSVDWFDIQQLIIHGSISKPEDVLLVDAGGGEGHYLRQFREIFPETPGRLILQDLPQVFSTIENLSEDIELMPYNFFGPQPVKGLCHVHIIYCALS